MNNIPIQQRKYTVSIEYCVPCDYSQHALAAATELVRDYQHVIARLELVMGSKGVFNVMVDENIIFSKANTGRFLEAGEILNLFEQAVGIKLEKYPHE